MNLHYERIEAAAPIVTDELYGAIAPGSIKINTNGSFIRQISPAPNHNLPRFGGYDPGRLRSQVLQLLHEIGHLTITAAIPAVLKNLQKKRPAVTGRKLTPLLAPDGNDPTLSESNTNQILTACRAQIDALQE
jgi:hypothetical protein